MRYLFMAANLFVVPTPYVLPISSAFASVSDFRGIPNSIGAYILFIFLFGKTIEQLICVHSNLLQGFKLNDLWLRGFVTVFFSAFLFRVCKCIGI